jgi:hypothetical protein
MGLLLGMSLVSCIAGDRIRMTDEPFSPEALTVYCRLPASCSKALACDGRVVTVAGHLNPRNIFDKQRYPHLPYEKFTLVGRDGHSIEVWPQAVDNQPIFNKLARRPSGRVVVTGRLKVVKRPSMDACQMGVKVLIDDASQIAFE